MNSSAESPFERAKAQISELDRTLETERDHFRTVVKAHETNIDSLRQSLQQRHQSTIIDAENAFKASAEARDDLERQLQEEKQRVIELTAKLDETTHNETTVKLASEKVNHGLTKMALDKSRGKLEEAMRTVESLEKYSKAVEQQRIDLWRDLKDMETHWEQLKATNDAVNKCKDHVGAELELSKRKSADVQQRLKASEQRNVDLEAGLKAATGRASGAEDELKAFKSLFQRINDDMSSLATSSGKQPVVAQSMSSAPAPNDQGSGPHRKESLPHPQSPGPQVSNTASDKESTLLQCKSILDEVMDTTKNWESNQYFLKTVDSLILASRDAKVGPMTLGTMKEKLTNGAYNSVTCFKADFDSMIADARKLNTPQNPVHIAAEQLSKTFDQAFSSSLPTSGHQPHETARSAQGINDKKRKAGTDAVDIPQGESAQKRRSLAPSEQSSNHSQPVSSGTGGSLTSAHSSSDQAKDNSHGATQTDADRVLRQLSTDISVDIEANLSAVFQLVSFIKSPSTLPGNWESLVPNGECELIDYVSHTKVEDRITMLVQSFSRDMIVLRLTPANEADRSGFNRVFEHLIEKKRYARVSHLGTKDVEDIYLIPTSRERECYPTFFNTLDFGLLPPIKTENVLLMAIVFKVAEDAQKAERQAWDGRMKAVRKREAGGLVAMRDTLTRHPLHIFGGRRAVVSSAEHHLASLSDLTHWVVFRSEYFVRSFLRSYGEALPVLRLDYQKSYSGLQVDSAKAPTWVFVLGCLVLKGMVKGTIVVNLADPERALWLIGPPTECPSGPTLTLVASTFPSCLKEWEDAIPKMGGVPNKNGDRCLKNTGLEISRCKFSE